MKLPFHILYEASVQEAHQTRKLFSPNYKYQQQKVNAVSVEDLVHVIEEFSSQKKNWCEGSDSDFNDELRHFSTLDAAPGLDLH